MSPWEPEGWTGYRAIGGDGPIRGAARCLILAFGRKFWEMTPLAFAGSIAALIDDEHGDGEIDPRWQRARDLFADCKHRAGAA